MATILFLHQSFPSQFLHLARALSQIPGYKVCSMGLARQSSPVQGVTHFTYSIMQHPGQGTASLGRDFEIKMIRAWSVAQQAEILQKEGFYPDLIISHSGWGESLLLRGVWPQARILHYQEYYYNTTGSDFDFDPEFRDQRGGIFRAISKNASLLLSLQYGDWNVTPTFYQHSLLPDEYRRKCTVVHDGIDTVMCAPSSERSSSLEIRNLSVRLSGKYLVTYVSRSLEPIRGFHSFMRCLPRLFDRRDDIEVVIVGARLGTSYGARRQDGQSWLDALSLEIGLKNQSWSDRVHFTDQIPYHDFKTLMQRSDCHVYLTYPFVLSWSCLEAMSFGCPIVGSDTAPVREMISHRENGLLVNFFDPQAIADSICLMLDQRDEATRMGLRARETIIKKYKREISIDAYIRLIEDLLAHGNGLSS